MTARHQIRVGGRRLGRDRSPIDATPAPTVGEMLQAARIKKGVDLYRAERDTKIRARHLAALENGDELELPGSVYTRGFLRNYSLYLGLDPDELLTRWRDERAAVHKPEPVAVVAPPQPIAEPRRGLTFTPGLFVAALLTVVVLAFAGYVGLQLVRFSQNTLVAIDGPSIVDLATDAESVTFSGTATPRAQVSAYDAEGTQIKRVGADDSGRWTMDLPVSRGTNEFSFIARDPDTDRPSDPVRAIVKVPVPATPTPVGATPAPVPTPLGATPAPGATGDPAATGSLPLARVVIDRPSEQAQLRHPEVTVSGTSDARTVRIAASYVGLADGDPQAAPRRHPTAPEPVWVPVRSGSYSKAILLPAGRWSIDITSPATPTTASTTVSRIVDVTLNGWYVTVEAPDGRAWIRLTVDGEQIDPGHNFRAGERITLLVRDTVEILTGNEKATVVSINGERIGPLSTRLDYGTWFLERGSRTPQRAG